MIQYFFSVPFIILAIILAFYIPGRVVLGKQKAEGMATFACSMILGLVLWGWQGYIFGYLNVRFSSYLYLIIFIILFIYKKYYIIRPIKTKKIDFLSVFMVIFGTIAQVGLFYKNGLITGKGIYISPFNPADHIWHTSLINEMVKRFPPYEPGMYGIAVTNYHYWFNLITAELIRVFHLPLFQTQYIGMYFFGSLMLGVTAYVFSTSIIKSKSFVRWLLFFLYFGGDASYWLSFITARVLDFHVPSVIEYATIFMDNPPRAFSIIIMFITLYLIFQNLKNMKKREFIIISVLTGTLVGFKIYMGISALAGLGLLAFYFLVFKRDLKISGIFILACVLSLIIFIPVNANAGGMFFNLVDRPRDFITYHPLGLYEWDMRWRIYLEHNNYIRIIQYVIMMTTVYFFAQFGTRLIGIIPYKKALLTLGREKNIFIYGTMIFSFLVGLFFSQSAHASDSFNFFIAGGFSLTILTSLNLTLFLDNKKLIFKLIIILMIIIFALPRWVYSQIRYFPLYILPGNFYGVSIEEMNTYNFLKGLNQNSLILVLNKNNLDQDSALVGTITNKNMFLSGQGVIEAHNAVNKERSRVVNAIRNTKSVSEFVPLTKKYNINYIYLYKNDNIKLNLKTIEKYKVFENNVAIIYKVN